MCTSLHFHIEQTAYFTGYIWHKWGLTKNKVILDKNIYSKLGFVFICIDSSNLSSETFIVEFTMEKLLNSIQQGDHYCYNVPEY